MGVADLELILTTHDGGSTMVVAFYIPPSGQTHAQLLAPTPLPAPLDHHALLRANLDLLAYGQILTDFLFGPTEARTPLFTALQTARGNAHGAQVPLRIRLHITPVDSPLHGLRWETLCDPATPMALLACDTNIRFCRYLDSQDTQDYQLPHRPQLRALVVVANPTDLGAYGLAAIDVAAWQQQAREALTDIAVTVLPQATWPALLDALQKGYDVLYLVCHGSLLDGQPELWLEQTHGSTHHVQGVAFVNALRYLARRPLVTVLAACQTAGRGEVYPTPIALAPQLITMGLPAVIAMNGSIGIATAATFMGTLFHSLMRDGQIDAAVAVARQQVRDRSDWWMPVLWMRLRDGRLWCATPAGVERYQVYGLPNPYLGLRAFTYRDRANYTGRTALIAATVRQITAPGTQQSLVFITGASGSGKSSFAMAGLLPALEQHYHPPPGKLLLGTLHPHRMGGVLVGSNLHQAEQQLDDLPLFGCITRVLHLVIAAIGVHLLSPLLERGSEPALVGPQRKRPPAPEVL